MRKQYLFGLLSLLLFTGACSGDGKAVVTTTTTMTVPATTTTLDAVSIREAKKANLLSELFIDMRVGDYDKQHKFFAATEEVQQILRKYGIFGNVKASFTGYDALVGVQVQRELCDDWLLEDLVASAKPSRVVGRFFSWAQQPGTEDSTAGAIFAHGGMNIFEVSDNGVADFVADYFALRGGACKPTSYQYGFPNQENWQEKFDTEILEQWWTEEQLLKIGVEKRTKLYFEWDSAYFGSDSESRPGFRIVQTAGNRSSMRVFQITPNIEMGLLTVIELNIIRNGTSKNSASITELARTYGPAFAELSITMESKLEDYLANGPKPDEDEWPSTTSDRIESPVAPEAYRIGDVGPAGGTVFIIPSTPGNTTGLYFEVAPSMSEVKRAWVTGANQDLTVPGASGNEIGDGAANTAAIARQARNVAESSAAVYASEYSVNGFSDWFLPSKDELDAMFANRASVGGFSDANYWSSSEVKANYAWSQNILYGTQVRRTKNSTFYVRPVRAFP